MPSEEKRDTLIFRTRLKPTLNLLDSTSNLQSADDSADSSKDTNGSGRPCLFSIGASYSLLLLETKSLSQKAIDSGNAFEESSIGARPLECRMRKEYQRLLHSVVDVEMDLINALAAGVSPSSLPSARRSICKP